MSTIDSGDRDSTTVTATGLTDDFTVAVIDASDELVGEMTEGASEGTIDEIVNEVLGDVENVSGSVTEVVAEVVDAVEDEIGSVLEPIIGEAATDFLLDILKSELEKELTNIIAQFEGLILPAIRLTIDMQDIYAFAVNVSETYDDTDAIVDGRIQESTGLAMVREMERNGDEIVLNYTLNNMDGVVEDSSLPDVAADNLNYLISLT